MPLEVVDTGIYDRDSTTATAVVTIPYTLTDASAPSMVVACAAQYVSTAVTGVTVDGISVPFEQHANSLYSTLDGCVLVLDLSGTTPSLSGNIVITWTSSTSKMGAYAWVTLASVPAFNESVGLALTGASGDFTKNSTPFTSLVVACRYTYSTGGATVTSPTAVLEETNVADGTRRLVDFWTVSGEFYYDFVEGYQGGVYVAVIDPAVFTAQLWPKGGNIYAPI